VEELVAGQPVVIGVAPVTTSVDGAHPPPTMAFNHDHAVRSLEVIAESLGPGERKAHAAA
jgi:hypothetical protein